MNSLVICPLFSDHAVLLRSEKVPVWGRGRPGATVEATLNGQSVSTCVKPAGRWEVQFNTLDMPDGLDGQLALVVESEGECLISHDIVVGEVWLCSGQSNMGMRLVNTAEADVEIARPPEPRLRHFKVKPMMAPALIEDLREGEWQICTPDTVGDFSAVAHYFGKRLLEAQGGVVGIINSSWGNTTLEAWSSAAAMDEIPELHAERLRDDACPVREGDDAIQQSGGAFEGDTRLPKHRSTVLFHAMIHPLIPCAIRGIVWYQGESNVARASLYARHFPIVIADWRRRWDRGDLPFYFCQIASYTHPSPAPQPSQWAELREAQQAALKLACTAMTVLTDAGEAEDIHPRDKRTPGERLATLALAKTYGVDLPTSGPVYRSCHREEARLRIAFHTAEGGLIAAPLPAHYPLSTALGTSAPLLPPRPGSEVQGFAIRGAQGEWFWADASIQGESVLLSHPEVPEPIAARYAWADFPVCNLTDATGLPTAGFRTEL